jgi:hypothetical protein
MDKITIGIDAPEELREPLLKAARERCACGKISLPPVSWNIIAKGTRKWHSKVPHRPARHGGCVGVESIGITEDVARRGNFAGGSKKGGGEKRVETKEGVVMNARLAEEIDRARSSILRAGKRLGFIPTVNLDRSVSWSEREAEAIKEELVKRPKVVGKTFRQFTGGDLISNIRLAKQLKRNDMSTMKYGRLLGYTPVKANGLLSWSKEQAQAIGVELAKAKIINPRRTFLGKLRGREPTHKADWLTQRGWPSKYTTARIEQVPPERRSEIARMGGLAKWKRQGPQHKSKEAPLAKWLKLQMEQAGVTYCLYEKDKGIIIRRQRVVEEEEKYE